MPKGTDDQLLMLYVGVEPDEQSFSKVEGQLADLQKAFDAIKPPDLAKTFKQGMGAATAFLGVLNSIPAAYDKLRDAEGKNLFNQLNGYQQLSYGTDPNLQKSLARIDKNSDLALYGVTAESFAKALTTFHGNAMRVTETGDGLHSDKQWVDLWHMFDALGVTDSTFVDVSIDKDMSARDRGLVLYRAIEQLAEAAAAGDTKAESALYSAEASGFFDAGVVAWMRNIEKSLYDSGESVDLVGLLFGSSAETDANMKRQAKSQVKSVKKAEEKAKSKETKAKLRGEISGNLADMTEQLAENIDAAQIQLLMGVAELTSGKFNVVDTLKAMFTGKTTVENDLNMLGFSPHTVSDKAQKSMMLPSGFGRANKYYADTGLNSFIDHDGFINAGYVQDAAIARYNQAVKDDDESEAILSAIDAHFAYTMSESPEVGRDVQRGMWYRLLNAGGWDDKEIKTILGKISEDDSIDQNTMLYSDIANYLTGNNIISPSTAARVTSDYAFGMNKLAVPYTDTPIEPFFNENDTAFTFEFDAGNEDIRKKIEEDTRRSIGKFSNVATLSDGTEVGLASSQQEIAAEQRARKSSGVLGDREFTSSDGEIKVKVGVEWANTRAKVVAEGANNIGM